MTQPGYTFQIRVQDHGRVEADVRGPSTELLYELKGRCGWPGQSRERILEIHEMAASTPAALSEAIVREMGEGLFNVLFDETLRIHFFNIYERSREEDAILRVELDVDEERLPELAALPWEFACLPADSAFGTLWLGTAPTMAFSRRHTLWRAARPIHLKPGERLRIALAAAAPTQGDLSRVQYEKVWGALRALADKNPEQIELLDLVSPASLTAIDDCLEKKPHIFHLIGHGDLVSGANPPYARLALVGKTGAPKWVTAATFSDLFVRHRPGLVVLQACESGALSSSSAFVGAASKIVNQNIPVVAAMQYAISNYAAGLFAVEFYKRLAQKDPVDKAAQEGRRCVALEGKGYAGRDFATPVLFMRVQDGSLFQTEEPEREETRKNGDIPQRVDTGGGTFIHGDIHINGGDFIGRDKIVR